MTISKQTLPDDTESLKAMVMNIAAKHTDVETALSEQETENKYLREQIRLLLHKRFGSSSEKLSHRDQIRLFLDLEDQSDTDDDETDDERVAIKEYSRAKRGRKPLPDSLPRIEIIHDLTDDEKICPHDGQALKKIGEETSEQLSYIPAEIRVLRHVRLKYACPSCDEWVKLAALPPPPIPKSMASPSLLAFVATSKYEDALPLYRQSKILKRIGVDLPRTTLANWMIKVGTLVQPIINLLQDDLFNGPVIQCDETRNQVLKESGKTAQSQSYSWVRRGGTRENPVVLFHYSPSRGGEVAEELLADYRGYLQTDGYAGYNAVCSKNAEIYRVGCWAHSRRKFDEALKAQAIKLGKKSKKGKPRDRKRKGGKALEGLKYIRQLYEIEKEIRDESAQTRKSVRQARARPILAEMKKWLQKSRKQVPPKSLTGSALGYLHDQWDVLNRYLDDGCLEIDNNLVENAIRPFAVGRKNWLFSDTVAGAEASANIYGLIETAKAQGLEPYGYLCHLFSKLPLAKTVEEVENLKPGLCTRDDIVATLKGEVPI